MFRQVKENFICLKCGYQVQGTGYTDHCPDCLTSLHVDQEGPGDRASSCRGMMIPQAAISKNGSWEIMYQCQKCGVNKIIHSAKTDNIEELIKLSKQPFKYQFK